MARKTLWLIGGRYLLRHPWQSILMIVGITLGVAVVAAVDLANAGAGRAFDLSTAAVAGKATHQITGGPLGLDEGLYTRLRSAGLAIPLAPVLVEYALSPQLGNRPLQLLGVDPFTDAPFRTYLAGDFGGSPSAVTGDDAIDLTAFLTQPGALLISEDVAVRYGVAAGSRIDLEIGGRVQPALIAGVIREIDPFNRRALEGLLLADVGTAQELIGRLGALDRIDVILPEDDPQMAERLTALLPDGVRLDTVAARSGAVAQMSSAFRVNLTALSLLALVVGMFLIYNTITFSVVQRRPLFGTLRCLGVTQMEVFLLVIFEALVIGAIGACIGLGLGVLMGQGALQLVTRTINDLFFVVTVRGVQVPPFSLVKAGALGILATLLSAAPPAWEAASVAPRQALSRSGLEAKASRAVFLAALGSLGMVGLGIVVLMLSGRSLPGSFGATFLVVVGAAMLVPLITGAMMRRSVAPLGRLWGSLGRMAARNVSRSLSRTAVAVMALMVAVSVTIGVSLMVGSFRGTVITWLSETLQGDIYISVPGVTASAPSGTLEAEAVRIASSRGEVRRVDVLRVVTVDSPHGPVEVAATDNSSLTQERIFLTRNIPVEQMWKQMQDGGVIVSEPFANRVGLSRQGGQITLLTPSGLKRFAVIGVYYDYANTQGTVMMALDTYRRIWDDQEITAMALRLNSGSDPDAVTHALQEELAPVQRLLVRPNRLLRDEVLAVFDRTFAITGALQLLATIVAFIGVLSSLLSLELERRRELGILRAVGMTGRQVWGLVLLETGLVGGAAGLLALPTGYGLALILVYIINRRSFGWTLQMQFEPQPFLAALVIAVGAALLAGLYPAWRMSRMITSEALRSE